MPRECSAVGCKNGQNTESKMRGITFHKFPSDAGLRQAWEDAVGRENFIATTSNVLCSTHFTADSMDRRGPTTRVWRGAVPSRFKDRTPRQKACELTFLLALHPWFEVFSESFFDSIRPFVALDLTCVFSHILSLECYLESGKEPRVSGLGVWLVEGVPHWSKALFPISVSRYGMSYFSHCGF
ncbi:DNA transposase THAP9 [Chionoecetes opilio]|uniref:DNA transposase THAP9 n=1 Tax=Chionoecetes opilio TaxID=41210 RepID=A0A8J4Y6G8_CHIOP|nr:DNA transposase THAP9 [Chionoecetes opilio]